MTDSRDQDRGPAASRWRRATFAFVLLAVTPSPATACSLRPPWEYRTPRSVPFIGTALSDTLLAGPGMMNPIVAIGHSGRGQPREIFGQRVQIDRVGDIARRAFPQGATEVVLVPWDFDAGCETVAWGRSARWLSPGTAGLFSAELRDREHWVDGLPTFDVLSTAFQPYRSASENARRQLPLLDSKALLTADELLRFFDELPLPSSVPDSVVALAELRRLTSDPVVASKYPVKQFIFSAREAFRAARRGAIRVPIAGTFRIVLERIGGATTSAFLRVDDGVTMDDLFMVVDTVIPPAVPGGYDVQATAAVLAEDLAPDCDPMHQSRQAYVSLAWHGPTPSDGNGLWLGDFDDGLFEVLMSADSAAAQRARRTAGWQRKDDSLRALGAPFPEYVPYRTLRFEQRPGEPMRISGEVSIEYLGTFRVRGERISSQVLACDR